VIETALLYHDGICERFRTLKEKGRLGHAYLLTGPRSVGKSETVLAIARMINCEQGQGAPLSGCGQCPSCRKTSSGQHPDVFIVEAGEEASIKIAVIRDLIQRLQLRPFEFQMKIVLIKDAELMTLESSNAFLKTLEEPPRDTVIFLTSSSPELLLGTIRSRCHAVPFFSSPRAEIAGKLAARSLAGEDPARFSAYFADGCAGQAQQLLEKGFFDFKNQVIDRILLQPPADGYLKELLGSQEETRAALEVLLSWFRDVVYLRGGAAAEELTNRDRISDLNRWGRTCDLPQIYGIVGGIGQALKYLDENLNVKIVFYLLMEKIWARAYKSV